MRCATAAGVARDSRTLAKVLQGCFNARFAGGDDSFDILELRAADELRESPALPDVLAAPAAPAPRAAAPVRRFALGSRDINGRQMDPTRIDQVLQPDTSEIWEVENEAGIPHNFHPHGLSFEVIEYDSAPPPPELSGRKDTLFVPPGVTARLVTTAANYADADSPFMFHCHLLEHEDRGMMGQFVVAERATAGPAARSRRHGTLSE